MIISRLCSSLLFLQRFCPLTGHPWKIYTLLCAQISLGLGTLRFNIYLMYEYFRDPLKLRRLPRVSVALFANAWEVVHQFFHARTVAGHKVHVRYGKLVRILSSHISFSTADAIRTFTAMELRCSRTLSTLSSHQHR